MKILVLTVSILAVSAALAEKYPFERYQSVIDRQMFGPLPRGFDPTKLPSEAAKGAVSEKQLTQEEEKLKSSIHFSMINITPDGATAVGFTDNSNPKTPVHYYLKVGETSNGWTVKEADAIAATMTIAKDEIEVALSLGANSAKGGGTTSRAGSAPATASAQASGIRRPFGSGFGGGLLSRSPTGMPGSLRERRNLRQQEAAQREAEAQKKADEEKARQAAEREVAEAEKAAAASEREEQRRQLLAISEELKRAREEKEKLKAEAEESSDANDES